MLSRRRDALILAALTVASYALAFLQRPGLAVSDTKIDLQVDPARFLADAAAPWSSDISLGHVQSGQYGGYVFPMGPFFALWRDLGLSSWVTERLWLGTMFALAAWGVVLLLDALRGRPRGVAHVAATAVFVLNPYVVTYTSRVSVSLLGYAALPWLLLFVHRGLAAEDGLGGGRDGADGTASAARGRWATRRSRLVARWTWPGAFALVVTSSGGGINAAVTAWVLLGPVLLLLYEPLVLGAAWRSVWAFVWRTVVVGAVTSLWWVVPLLVQSKWGLPFLPYTEQPGTIWGTTSASESLRLMGFWLSYVGVGYGGKLAPYTTDAGTLLFWVPAMVASLVVPALALGGFAWTRRWRFGPFFLLLVLVGVLAMIAGFPEGTPLRHGMTFAYNHLVSLQTLRTTYKAGPLVALGLAALGGAAMELLWRRARAAETRRRDSRTGRWRPLTAGLAVVAAGLLLLAAWPLIRGRGVDQQLTWKSIPAAWQDTADAVDSTLGDDRRAMVLPGQLFSAYTWGSTVDPILPTLATKPVAVRQVVPFADLRSVDLQWATDALVSQQRQLPGQLPRALALQSVGQVVSGTDDNRGHSGALGANEAARELALGGLGQPTAAYGPVRRVPAEAGSLAAPLALPQVRRYAVGSEPQVQLLPRATATVVDGSADGVLGLAAFGPLPPNAPVRYAADLTPAQLRALAATGSSVTISDSNRRRVFVPSRLRGNQGATLAPDDPISADGHQLDPWPGQGTDDQTVAQLSGVRYVRAPFSPQVTQFPEHRPFAALDGDPGTAWLADRSLSADRWYLDVGLKRKQDVPYLDLLPYRDRRGRVRAVTVNGKPFAVHPGWNRLRVDLHDTDLVRILMADVARPAHASSGAGGLREVRIPGVTAAEALRVPVDAERALKGASLAHTPLTYLFARTTGDNPFRRETVHGPWEAGYVRDQGDGETGLERVFDPPAARTWTPSAWLTVAPATPDHTLDQWAGGTYPGALDSSSRFENQPRWRASSAFDARAGTAWIGGWLDASSRAWVSWTAPKATTVQRLTLVAPAQRVRRPTRVRLVVDGAAGPSETVGTDGRVALPSPVTGRAFRLEILAAAFPPGTSGVQRQRRAVGIAEVRGTGLAQARPRTSGALHAPACDVRFTVGGQPATLRLAGTVETLDAGRPLRGVGCDARGGRDTAAPDAAAGDAAARAPAAASAGAVPLYAGPQKLSFPGDGAVRVDLLQLHSAAPVPVPAVGSAGTVLSPGMPGRGARSDIRLRVRAPAWLVLGESYSTGWRATCDGRNLGAPTPLQGYAVGWPVDPGCTTVDVVFAGNRPVAIAFWISLVASLLVLALVLVGLRRRRRALAAAAAVAPEGLEARPTPRMRLRTALLWGVAAALAGGFVFAIRAGVFIGPAVAFILWRGVGARTLSLLAGGLLAVVVPILYVVVPVHNHGGYDTNAPLDRIQAHWVAVAAIVLLMLALYRVLADNWRRPRARKPRTKTPPAATT